VTDDVDLVAGLNAQDDDGFGWSLSATLAIRVLFVSDRRFVPATDTPKRSSVSSPSTTTAMSTPRSSTEPA